MLVHWLLIAALPSALADASPRLFHRVVDPASPDAPFVPRALLSVTGSGPAARASLAPAQNLHADLAQFASAVHHTPDALYQVALERDADPSTWDVSSVKAVSLPTGAGPPGRARRRTQAARRLFFPPPRSHARPVLCGCCVLVLVLSATQHI